MAFQRVLKWVSCVCASYSQTPSLAQLSTSAVRSRSTSWSRASATRSRPVPRLMPTNLSSRWNETSQPSTGRAVPRPMKPAGLPRTAKPTTNNARKPRSPKTSASPARSLRACSVSRISSKRLWPRRSRIHGRLSIGTPARLSGAAPVKCAFAATTRSTREAVASYKAMKAASARVDSRRISILCCSTASAVEACKDWKSMAILVQETSMPSGAKPARRSHNCGDRRSEAVKSRPSGSPAALPKKAP